MIEKALGVGSGRRSSVWAGWLLEIKGFQHLARLGTDPAGGGWIQQALQEQFQLIAKSARWVKEKKRRKGVGKLKKNKKERKKSKEKRKKAQ